MLRIRTGEPGWYNSAVVAALLLLILALLIEPLQPAYVLMLVSVAVVITWLDLLGRRRQTWIKEILVFNDFSVALITRDGAELPTEGPIRSWVTRCLIVIRVKPSGRGHIHLMIAPSMNEPQAYRRFTVLCRFGFAVDDPERHNVTQLNPKEA